MRANAIIYITLSSISFGASIIASYGQAKNLQGTIQEAEFIIKKEKKNQLPDSNRLVKKAPVPLPTEQADVKLQYELYDIPLDFQPLNHKIKILKAKQDRITNLYGKYLKLGYGNYHMPYIAAFLDNTSNKKYDYGLHLSHLSEGREKYAQEYHNAINLHGRMLTEILALCGSIDYKLIQYPFMNFVNNPTNIKNDPNKYQSYYQIQLHTSLYNYLQAPFNYQIHSQVTHLGNHQSIYEHQGKINFQGDYTLNEIFQVKADLDLHLIQYTHPNTTTLQRHVGRFKPIFVTKFKEFELQTGANLAYQNSAAALAEKFHVYPELKLTYALNKAFRPYIGLSGNIQANAWQDYIVENPWLSSWVDLQHTKQNFICYAGAQSDILDMLSCHTGLSISNYQNWPCFVNNPTDPREFDIKYDTSATVVHIFTELTKTSFAEALVTRLKAAYFHYTLNELQKPWHKPQYNVEVLNTYKFHGKILLKANLYWLGGIQALEPSTQARESLPEVVNIDLGIEYLWNQRFSIFIDCQNILAKSNNAYLYAPPSGVHLLLGISYAW